MHTSHAHLTCPAASWHPRLSCRAAVSAASSRTGRTGHLPGLPCPRPPASSTHVVEACKRGGTYCIAQLPARHRHGARSGRFHLEGSSLRRHPVVSLSRRRRRPPPCLILLSASSRPRGRRREGEPAAHAARETRAAHITGSRRQRIHVWVRYVREYSHPCASAPDMCIYIYISLGGHPPR